MPSGSHNAAPRPTCSAPCKSGTAYHTYSRSDQTCSPKPAPPSTTSQPSPDNKSTTTSLDPSSLLTGVGQHGHGLGPGVKPGHGGDRVDHLPFDGIDGAPGAPETWVSSWNTG